MPEVPSNLGKSLLVHGAVAFIGAVRTPWARSFWDDESDGGCFSIEYFTMKYLVDQGQTCAEEG